MAPTFRFGMAGRWAAEANHSEWVHSHPREPGLGAKLNEEIADHFARTGEPFLNDCACNP